MVQPINLNIDRQQMTFHLSIMYKMHKKSAIHEVWFTFLTKWNIYKLVFEMKRKRPTKTNAPRRDAFQLTKTTYIAQGP